MQVNLLQKLKWNKGRIIIIFVVTKNEQIWLANKVGRQQKSLFKGTEMDNSTDNNIINSTDLKF